MRRLVLGLLGLWLAAGRPAAAATVTAGAAPDGAALFAQNCALCHQADANGAPGQYPPLRNRLDRIAGSPDGKHYLADVLTGGMAGMITANGGRYIGYMPTFAQLPDDQIAAILTYVASLGDTRPVPVLLPADVAAARAVPHTPTAVAQERKALNASHPIP